MIFRIIIVFFIYVNLAHSDLSGERTTNFVISEAQGLDGKIQANIFIKNPTNTSPRLIVEESRKKIGTAKLEKRPENFFLLIDSSSLCQNFSIDTAVSSYFPNLLGYLHKDSLVTVASFSKDRTFVFYEKIQPREIRHLNFTCEKEAKSGSLSTLFKDLKISEQSSKFSQTIMIFTAGNLNLSNEALSTIANDQTTFVIVNFNPFLSDRLEGEIDQLDNSTNSVFHYHSMPSLDSPLPALWYNLVYSPPRKLHGKNLNYVFNLEYKIEDTYSTVDMAQQELVVPRSKYHDLYVFLDYLIIVASLALFIILVRSLFRYYMPSKCSNCKRYIRKKDQTCFHCLHDVKALFSVRLENSKDKVSLLGVKSNGQKIGSDRTSAFDLYFNSSMKRIPYLDLRYKKLINGDDCMIVTPTKHALNYKFLFNGKRLISQKYLKQGDTLQVPGATLVFLGKYK